MQQEHVFFLPPAFLSSMSSTVCPVLPTTNNFWATDPMVGTQGKPQEPQSMKHPSRTRCGGTAAVAHRDTLRSAFLGQWEAKKDRRPRDRQRYQPYPRSLPPPCTHRERPKSLQLLRGLDFVCQQPRGERRAGEGQSKVRQRTRNTNAADSVCLSVCLTHPCQRSPGHRTAGCTPSFPRGYLGRWLYLTRGEKIQ